MLKNLKRKTELFALIGTLIFATGCLPTNDGEFSTNGRPTSSSEEKLSLITGVSDGSIFSVFFIPKAKQYLITYVPKRIGREKLAAAEQRMCRYRKLTYDRAGKDEPLNVNYNGTPPPSPNPFEGARTRTFFCR